VWERVGKRGFLIERKRRMGFEVQACSLLLKIE
jgi:hypothetical protein